MSGSGCKRRGRLSGVGDAIALIALLLLVAAGSFAAVGGTSHGKLGQTVMLNGNAPQHVVPISPRPSLPWWADLWTALS